MNRIRNALRPLASLFGLRDLFVFGGLASLGYGIWQVHVPAAWMVIGLLIFLIGMRR